MRKSKKNKIIITIIVLAVAVVGGIGIMNIMLVSVTERTREIGIRKAIGATRKVILIQFLFESLMLSLIGCVIGIILSQAALSIGNVFQQQISLRLSPVVALVSTAFSLGICLIFGIYPANKAARMKPIDALRYND